MRSYLMTGYSIGQLLHQAVENGGVQMLRGPIGHEQVLAAVREAGSDGIVLAASTDRDAGAADDTISWYESDYAVAHVTEAADVRAQIEERRVHVLILDLGSARSSTRVGVYAALQAEGRAKPTIIIAGGAGGACSTIRSRPASSPSPMIRRLLLEQIERLAA